MTWMARSITTTLMTSALAVAAASDYVSPRWLNGDIPAIPVAAIAGGDVCLEVLVAPDGRVSSIEVLRATPPFTDSMVAAVRGWRFEPASVGSKDVEARVLVAGMFAPPSLTAPTLGEAPQTLRAPSSDVPAPASISRAPYPPRATGNGAVLVDATIGPAGGAPVDARIVVSSPAFDGAALATARSWSFEPAQRDGRAVTAHAYLLFAFRQPVT